MLSVSEREAYLHGEMDAELGPTLMAAIRHLVRVYADRVNARLSKPVIEQVAATFWTLWLGLHILRYQFMLTIPVLFEIGFALTDILALLLVLVDPTKQP